MNACELRTPRLLLRPWRESDLAPFAALNVDPPVLEHFDHPRLPAGHRLRRHVLYRITAEAWRAKALAGERGASLRGE